MGIRAVCPRCANRWCGAVDPHCPICDGRGHIASGAGPNPLERLRAVVMHLEGVCWSASHPKAGERAKALTSVGLMASGSGDSGLVEEPADGTRNAIGRAAGRLLIDLGLRPRPPKRQPKKRPSAEELAAGRRRRAEEAESEERRRIEWERQRRDKKVRERVFDVLAAIHPEEVAELREGEEVLVALEENLPIMGAARPWQRARRWR